MRLPDDIPALRAAALNIGNVGAIILDPIASHVRGDTHTEAAVRPAIDPLNDLANELDCLIIGVRHLSEKGTPNGAIAGILGASAWVQVPRAVLAIAPDNDEAMLFHIGVVGGNRSARGAGRTFRIELVLLEGLKEPVTRAVDAGVSNKSIDDLLGADETRKAPLRDGCREIILRALADEAKPLDHLKAVCIAKTGCSGKTAWQAANALKAEGLVECRNSGPGTPWLWDLTSPSSHDFTVKSDGDGKVNASLTSPSDHPTHSQGKVNDFTVKSDPDFLTSPSSGTPQEDSEVNDDTDAQLHALFGEDQ
jgi:putative DNA primase/helicase